MIISLVFETRQEFVKLLQYKADNLFCLRDQKYFKSAKVMPPDVSSSVEVNQENVRLSRNFIDRVIAVYSFHASIFEARTILQVGIKWVF